MVIELKIGCPACNELSGIPVLVDGVSLVDSDGYINHVNPRAVRLERLCANCGKEPKGAVATGGPTNK